MNVWLAASSIALVIACAGPVCAQQADDLPGKTSRVTTFSTAFPGGRGLSTLLAKPTRPGRFVRAVRVDPRAICRGLQHGRETADWQPSELRPDSWECTAEFDLADGALRGSISSGGQGDATPVHVFAQARGQSRDGLQSIRFRVVLADDAQSREAGAGLLEMTTAVYAALNWNVPRDFARIADLEPFAFDDFGTRVRLFADGPDKLYYNLILEFRGTRFEYPSGRFQPPS